MNRVSIPFLVLALLAAQGTSFADDARTPRQTENAITLQPYIHCDGFAEGIRGVTLDRRPQDAPPWREVDLAGKIERVSVVDGYRVMYSYPRTFPFANLKAERSDPSQYGEDKRIVSGNMLAMAEADNDVALLNFSDRGYTGQTLTKKHLGGTTLGMTQIFSDDDAVIVTAFFLNQAPENRRFQTHEEFVLLRDSFVRGYIECVAERRSALVRAQNH